LQDFLVVLVVLRPESAGLVPCADAALDFQPDDLTVLLNDLGQSPTGIYLYALFLGARNLFFACRHSAFGLKTRQPHRLGA